MCIPSNYVQKNVMLNIKFEQLYLSVWILVSHEGAGDAYGNRGGSVAQQSSCVMSKKYKKEADFGDRNGDTPLRHNLFIVINFISILFAISSTLSMFAIV